MRREITLEEAKGLTFEGFTSYDEKAFLTFSSNAFVALSIDPGYDGDVGTIEPKKLDMKRASPYMLKVAGIIIEQEYKMLENIQHAQLIADQRRH